MASNSVSETERNKAALRRLLEEMVSNYDTKQLQELICDDVVLPDDPPGAGRGLEGYKAVLANARKMIDYTYTVEDMVAEGNKVYARITARGHQVGPMGDIPNTGRSFEYEQMTVAEFRDGKMSRFYRVGDIYSLQRQLRGEGHA